MQDGEFKICPYCRERIRETAIKCRFCGEWLQTPPAIENTSADILETNVSGETTDHRAHDPLDEFDTPESSEVVLSPTNTPEVSNSEESASPPPIQNVGEPPIAEQAEAHQSTLPTRKANYFVRHWHGDLSLGVSYWGNGFLVAFLFAIVVGIVAGVGQIASLRAVAILCIAMWLVWFALVVWQIVGTWRSAGNHEARGGKKGWANAARFFLVIGCLNLIVTTGKTVIPQIAEYWRILAGDTGFPAYEVRVLPSGNEVEFRGGLRAGSAKELERILKAVPQVKVLRINSVGGRIAEAQKMAKLVRERGLSTYTSEYCLSAATLVFVAGKERVVGEGAKLGFHSGSFPGLDAEQLKQVNEESLQAMRSAGVPEWFINQAFATSSADMWYPTLEELRRANVITREYSPVKSIASTVSALYQNSQGLAGFQAKSTGSTEMDRVQDYLVNYAKSWTRACHALLAKRDWSMSRAKASQ